MMNKYVICIDLEPINLLSKKRELISLEDYDTQSTATMSDKKAPEYDKFEIHLPQKLDIHRIPGDYEDVSSLYKKKHNKMIYKYSKLLKQDITALLLDGKKMRTSRALMKDPGRVERIHVIEINAISFNIMKGVSEDLDPSGEKIQLYNSHIMDYVLRGIDLNTNLIYLDVMCNFFDSLRTKGTEGIIMELFKQIRQNKILFAATFCLRNSSHNFSYDDECKEVIKRLKEIFSYFNWNFFQLNKDKEMRYKGQKHKNYGMMFVIYLLESKNNLEENIIIEL